MDEERKLELMMRDKAELADTELAELVAAMNEPTKVPPCPVCEEKLEPTSAGYGVMTRYGCPTANAEVLRHRSGDKATDEAHIHFDRSRFEDRRQTDPWAYELAFRILNVSEA